MEWSTCIRQDSTRVEPRKYGLSPLNETKDLFVFHLIPYQTTHENSGNNIFDADSLKINYDLRDSFFLNVSALIIKIRVLLRKKIIF